MQNYLSMMTQLEVVMHQQFTVVIKRDLESGWLVGSVAELPSCYTQAPDLASLERNMREAIQVFSCYGWRERPRALPRHGVDD